tara:strand:+ start:87 stop:1862 length:1776 start_codon:yes stop_codon:yes gene_type:complete
MKLSDYIAQFLANEGVKCVFGISGGAILHIFDSVARNPNIDYVCPQHEESVAMAADGYSRVTGNLGAGMVTSGPGGTNMLTGICSSYFDSIPTLFITGQVATFRLKRGKTVRQVGFQETDIVSIFETVTKYCILLKDPTQIKYHLQKAVYLAKSGRPGPVIIDLPDDLQRVDIDPNKLEGFTPPKKQLDSVKLTDDITKCLDLISAAQRPIFIFGAGISIAHAQNQIRELVDKLNIPFVLTWGAKDIWPHNHPLNVGGLGIAGPRFGNFSVQSSDLIIAMGTRLSQMLTGGKLEYFGREAKKVLIDIDVEEFNKFDGKEITIDLPILAEIKSFLGSMNERLSNYQAPAYSSWLGQISSWREEFPIVSPKDHTDKKPVDACVFAETLSEECKDNDVIIVDTGGNLTWTMQSFKVKANQKIFSAWNHSPMGYSLAAACGAALADRSREIICIIGDGGLQMCIEELATVSRHQLSIKIFLFNNHCHGIQKHTLKTWLGGRLEGVDHESGLHFPDFNKVAEAYGLPNTTIKEHDSLKEQIRDVLNSPGPMFCNVEINPEQTMDPYLTFGRPLEDLGPPLSRETLRKKLLIKPVDI